MKINEHSNARAIAAEMIARWMESGDFPDRMMNRVKTNRAFVMEVVYGVVKWKRELEWVLKQCMKHLPGLEVRAHLMVGLYQCLHMDSVEAYAAVNESVEAVKGSCGPGDANFVNAVLRRVLREKPQVDAALAALPMGERLSHPEVLVRRWIQAYGEPEALRLCEWNNRRAKVILRVNTERIQMDDFRDRLASSGLRTEVNGFDPARFCNLLRGGAIEDLPGYEDGWFMVQDPSTLMAVEMLDPRPQERILDACAAPGGKTVAIAERMGGGHSLTAMDIHADRMPYLDENLDRMGLQGVRLVEGDMGACRAGGVGVPELTGLLFDGILLDVPCMNTGVLQRRADARWRFSLERMLKVNETQRSILDGAAQKVRVGGRLVYSTCSLEPEEDEGMIAAWLQANPGFEKVAERKLLPQREGTDGAYAARLKRLA